MFRYRSTIVMIAVSIGFVGLLTAGVLFTLAQERPIGVNKLWQMHESKNLEGKRVTVRGDAIFMPQSDFKFNALYLIDSETNAAYRQPEYGLWFGVRVADLACSADDDAWTCEPFDPRQAQAFELEGILHNTQVGKKDILWLSGIDLAHSRQLINGEWQPMQSGKFIIPLR